MKRSSSRSSERVPLGPGFHRAWAASGISNLGDGVTVVASSLLIASLTDEPAAVAGVVFVEALPWLLFSLISGAMVDRVERVRLIVVVNVLRGIVLAGMAVAVSMGHAHIALLYVAFFLSGTGETLADNAAGALLPRLVPRERLAAANARLMATYTICSQFIAKPFGAYLFVVASPLPFYVDAISFLAAAAIMSTVRTAAPPASEDGPKAPAADARPSLLAEVGEGVRWLRGHRLLRTLALCMGLGNLVYCAAFAVFVIYARDRLGVSEQGYGFLLLTFAVGGLLGTGLATRLEARFGAATLLRAGLAIEAITHLCLALTDQVWVAVPVLIVFGVHTMVWGTVVTTLRQRLVPDRLLGRVGSAYGLFDAAGVALGALTGGLLAQVLGVVGPFWIAFATMTVVTIAGWRTLGEASRVPFTTRPLGATQGES